MDELNSCRCCLRGAPDKDLTTPYTHLGKTEIYSNMLKDCFDIDLSLDDADCGICWVCVDRLRDATDFKLQVQRCQGELQALKGEGHIKDVELVIKSEEKDVDMEDDKVLEVSYERYKEKSEAEEKNDTEKKDETSEVPVVKSEPPDGDVDMGNDEDPLTGADADVGPAVKSDASNDVANDEDFPADSDHGEESDTEGAGSDEDPSGPESSSSSNDEEKTAEDMEQTEFLTLRDSQASKSSNKANKQEYKIKKSSRDSSDEEANNNNGEEQLNISEESQVKTSSTATDENRLKSTRVIVRSKDFCLFCETAVLNFARHLIRNHSLEAEVQKILSYPKKSCTRKKLLTNLRKQGNYKANVSKCVKPMKKSDRNNDYLPCENCLGFYSRKLLWKHKKSCQFMSETSHSQVAAQNFMLRNLSVDKKLKEEVFCKMRPDHVSLEAKQDPLICQFGAQYLRTHREKHFINVTSRKMRELAKLLIELKKLKPGLKDLMDSLKPQNYDIIVTATKIIASFNDTLDRYGAPTYAMHISTSLKKCCNIAIMNILKSGSALQTASMQADVKTLIQLIETNWKFDVFSQACNDLNLKKCKKVTVVPLASELNDEKLHDILSSKLNADIGTTDKEISLPLSNVNANAPSTPTTVVTAKKKRNLVPWTSEQKQIVTTFFSKHIRSKRPPKRYECDELRGLHPDVLHNKDWLKIKVFVQNAYTKKT